MNILPKKSWHVRNKDNVERVRRDEENARLEEEERARRAAVAEQEARTALLRARSRAIKPSESSVSESGAIVSAGSVPQHINFFEDIEQGLKHGSNPEYEAEKKAEQEKYERGIGLLTYVGQSSVEAQADEPWYFQPRQKQEEQDKKKKKRDSRTEDDKKNSLDPLKTMKKYLAMKEERSQHQHKNHGRERHRKHKHKDSHHDKKKKKKKSLLELREERMRREREEHNREQRVLARARGEDNGTERTEQTDRHRYNSQFNPDLARKPRGNQRHYPY